VIVNKWHANKKVKKDPCVEACWAHTEQAAVVWAGAACKTQWMWRVQLLRKCTKNREEKKREEKKREDKKNRPNKVHSAEVVVTTISGRRREEAGQNDETQAMEQKASETASTPNRALLPS